MTPDLEIDSVSPLDLLAFGAHPDDVEMGVGGLLIKMKKKGYRTGVVDLTRGEMSSRGTPEIRAREARDASRLLQIDIRENLDLGDTRLLVNRDNILTVTSIIRKLRPSIIIAPYWIDHHPDHAATGALVQQAFFHVRLAKLDLGLPPHYPRKIYYYPFHHPIIPSFVVDITEEFPQRMEALWAYKSQLVKEQDENNVRRTIGISDYAFHVESRCRYFGSLINVKFGEALVVDGPLKLEDPCQGS